VISTQQWFQNFTIHNDDIEFLTTLLLERETPLDTPTLARTLIEERLRQEAARLQSRFQDAVLYNPAQTYAVGQRLVFSVYDFTLGEVVDVRSGDNPAYGDFSVIVVSFDDPALHPDGKPREFAAGFSPTHTLNNNSSNGDSLTSLMQGDGLSIDDIVNSDVFDDVVDTVENALETHGSLLNVAGMWFPEDLMLETHTGHMHLAEAILDMYGGGPMTTEAILQNIGGLGNAPMLLQVFSMNYGMSLDERFDEVGPAGEVLWYLRNMEPDQVRNVPEMLRYIPIDYDRDVLSEDARAMEEELGDEFSPLPTPPRSLKEARAVLIYPHRRMGTLPLNTYAARIFPTARKTERVAVTLVDAQDGETFPAWVVRKARYVHGLMPLYTKHALPVGTTIRLWRDGDPGRIIIDFDAYRPRSEWVTLVTANNGQIGFETAQRAIGATYDEFLLFGVDDLDGVDKLFQSNPQRQKPLATLLRTLIPLLSSLNTQGYVHTKTLYSAVNVIRRCPPGPIIATLTNNPDFENVGEFYWKLS
jgi:hypothetical protein